MINSFKEVLLKWSDCSRCQGVSTMMVILIIAAVTLDAQSLKEILIAAVSFSAGLANVGAGVNARGRGLDPQIIAANATAASSARNEVDPNASRNG